MSDLIGAAAVITAVTVVLGVLTAAARRYQTTFGRRRVLRSKLSKLASTVRVEYVAALLGPSTFRQALPDGLVQDVFVTDYAHVQTISDADGTALVVAVTTTDRHFRPRFAIGLPGSWLTDEVVLGRTRFSDLKLQPINRKAWLGARRFSYREAFYLGNPGGYQTFILGHEQSGVSGQSMLGDFTSIPKEDLGGSVGMPPPTSLATERFRSETLINTYAVTAPNFRTEALELMQIGVDADLVRLLPVSPTRRRLADRRTRRMVTSLQKEALKKTPTEDVPPDSAGAEVK